MGKTLQELAGYLGGSVIGDATAVVTGLSTLDAAVEGQITFLANPKYASKVASTRATAVVVTPGAESFGKNVIEVKNPYLAFAKLLTLFTARPRIPQGIMDGAFVGKNVTIGEGVSVYPGAFVADGVRIGNRVTLYPGVSVYEGAVLGDDVTLHANVSVRERCRIGNRVIVQNGAVIGSDGFGYAPDGKEWYKIPQVGIVVIEDDVEIGANSTIDRAALEVTLIRRGTKIDNMVQIAHNCSIGENCMIVSQVGIAGSSSIGSNVTIGGNTGIVGHVKIGDNAMIGGMSGVSNDVPSGQIVSGIPAFPHRDWLKASKVMQKLPDLRKSVMTMEKRLAELEAELAGK